MKITTARNSRVLRTIPLLITICLISLSAQAQYGGGTGEPNDPDAIAYSSYIGIDEMGAEVKRKKRRLPSGKITVELFER